MGSVKIFRALWKIVGSFWPFYYSIENLVLPPGCKPYGLEAGPGCLLTISKRRPIMKISEVLIIFTITGD